MIHSSIPQRVALSVGPGTQAAAAELRRKLAEYGCTVGEFVADGLGGRALELAVRNGQFTSVIDLTLTELAAELWGQPGSAGPDRLTAAALTGTPQVIVPGGCEQFNPTPVMIERLAKDIAHKASAARGPTAIVVPAGPMAEVFVAVQRLWLGPAVQLTVADVGVDESAFTRVVVAAWKFVTSTAVQSARTG